jgi:hypothetical protein
MDEHRQETASMANQTVDEMKYKAEVEEYAGDGRSAMAADFQQREAALRRKLDWYIAPVMMLCMLISYLDRGNIGFAATQGMSEEIGLTGNQLNVSGGDLRKKCFTSNDIERRLLFPFSMSPTCWLNFRRLCTSNVFSSTESFQSSSSAGG